MSRDCNHAPCADPRREGRCVKCGAQMPLDTAPGGMVLVMIRRNGGLYPHNVKVTL